MFLIKKTLKKKKIKSLIKKLYFCRMIYFSNEFDNLYGAGSFMTWNPHFRSARMLWSAKSFYNFIQYNSLTLQLRSVKIFRLLTGFIVRVVLWLHYIFRSNVLFNLSKAENILNTWRFFTFFFTLNELYTSFALRIFCNYKIFKIFQKRSTYEFIWNFKPNNLLFVNVRNTSSRKPKNFSFISLGLFLKFFEKKKTLKKNKLIKLAVIKYFRKLFIILHLRKLILIIKKNPIYLPEILNIFHQPLFILVNEPSKENPKKKKKITFNPPIFSYYFFIANKSFVKNKMQKKGRIKRKITKKLVSKNKIID